MTSRLNPSSLSRLLSRANAAESFNYNVSNRLKKLRTVDEGLPRTENLMIRSFKTWHQIDSQKGEFKSGDSAVLVPLVELSEDQQPWVIFTHRSYKLRKHRGEISFPGGGIDQGESIEEVGRIIYFYYFFRLPCERPRKRYLCIKTQIAFKFGEDCRQCSLGTTRIL
jgi:hypothetical protein